MRPHAHAGRGVGQRFSLTALVEVALPSAASTVTFSVAVTFLRGLANLSVSFASPALSSVLRALPSFLPLTVRVAETLQAPAHGTVSASCFLPTARQAIFGPAGAPPPAPAPVPAGPPFGSPAG